MLVSMKKHRNSPALLMSSFTGNIQPCTVLILCCPSPSNIRLYERLRVFLKCIAGAQEAGVEGFFKGVGRGILGLITKPALGVLDVINFTFDSLRRAVYMGLEVSTRGKQVSIMKKHSFTNVYLILNKRPQ